MNLTEVDILITMLDNYDISRIYNKKEGLIKVAWARNWFDAWAESPWIGEYDLLLASSPTACMEREGKLGRITLERP